MKVALLQVNTVIGDLAGNADRMAAGVREAARSRPDLILAPELALTGCPPRDLLLQGGFVERSLAVLEGLAADLRGAPPVIIGFAAQNPSCSGRSFHDAAALLEGGAIREVIGKTYLSPSGALDEGRYFEPAVGTPRVLSLGGRKVGISIGEEIWRTGRSAGDLVRAGADLIVNISASPFVPGKQGLREGGLSRIARDHRIPIATTNLVGGNDSLVFDGRSSVFGTDGTLIARGAAFAEDIVIAYIDRPGPQAIAPDDPAPESEVWRALVLGTRDYVRKTGFETALLGLSGGIDSSLVAAITARALGPESVLGVLLPSPYTSEESIEDAREVAENLGIRTYTLPITPAMETFDGILAEAFAGLPRDTTEENIQARIRAVVLMALANKFDAILLSTGNRSEAAVGYSTLYGDMAGGLSVIGDLSKGMVYRVSRWLNRERPVIPIRVLEKPPSAELRPGQTDRDTLPPYEILDAILHSYIECSESPADIIAAGYPAETVYRILRMVRLAEFKRRQAAPCIRVTERAFDTDWRMPIAARPWWEEGAGR